jgi:hypothetical protein
MTYGELSVVPCEIFIFTGIDLMLAHFDSWECCIKAQPFLKKVAGKYFPFLWDGSTTWLALDLNEKKGDRVMVIQFDSDNPLREAYRSFDECLEDIIMANENDVQLSFK